MLLKALGALLILASMACIIATFYEVASGKAAIFSGSAIGGYIFHPITMIAGVALILKGKKPKENKEAE